MTAVKGKLLQMLATVATALGDDLRERLIFVGGCTTALFITDPVTIEDVRATDDVDLIVDLAGYAAWAALQEHLRARGFSESPEDNVICRMRLGELKVDFMPDNEKILGFGNRWYAKGIETAVTQALTGELAIKRLTPPLFIATKLEAYCGRGNGDLLSSRDMEDILLVVDGRAELLEEVTGADADVRSYIAEQFRALLKQGYDLEDFLAGNIRGPEGRLDIVRRRFKAISQRRWRLTWMSKSPGIAKRDGALTTIAIVAVWAFGRMRSLVLCWTVPRQRRTAARSRAGSRAILLTGL